MIHPSLDGCKRYFLGRTFFIYFDWFEAGNESLLPCINAMMRQRNTGKQANSTILGVRFFELFQNEND